ncbi:translocation/assembly module TamB domain-containing protein [Sinorhizobium sp. BG8]|uniref:translocation/assembly module TamB domain-containing protein n=1 Tax=Sinorhizobium sp. BG8 TaxID=2613773 RepID=UPI00193D4903|nr:translocation/assembly module TamB domain-containing protein [Sinorhizobium sp. BG8]QRM53347.1 hypothetical protein F3Y30_01270 [Sinorhizobium sp. BG8]
MSLEGRLKRAQDGAIEVSAARLKSGTLDASGSAKLANGNLEASVSGTLPALGKLLADAEGKATFEATATGPLAALGVKAQVVSSGAKLAGRTLSDLVLTVDGKADPKSPSGTLTATGALDGQAINIKSDVVSQDGRISIPVLEAKVGPNILKGAVTLGADYLPVGNVTFEFPDIGLLAAMAGQRASGDLAGSAVIENTNGKTALTIKASGKGISRDALKVVNPSIDLRIADLQTAAISGEVRTDSIVSGSNRLERLKATFTREGNETIFDVAGQYDGAPLLTRGTVQQAGDQLRISLASFEASPRRVPIRLSKPTTFTLRGGDLALDGITIGAGNGTIAVSGAAGHSLNLAAKLTSLPASLANTFSAGLGAEGTIGGTVTVKGTPAQPNVAYQLQWQGARTSQTAAAGVGPLQIGAQGGFANNQVRLDLTLSGSGLSFKGGGTVGVTGNMPLSLKLAGTVPFDLIRDRLAAQGFSLTGNAVIDLSISGAAKSPVIAGTISTSGGRLVDVRRNLAVNDLTARVSLDGRQATIQQLSGRLATGGRISATGTVGIAPGSGYPANVAVTLTDLTYVDGTLVTANVAGDLTLKGPILTGLVIGGEVRIRRAGITIPEKLPASLSEIDIRHRNAPPAVLAMVKALEQVSGGGDAEGRGVGLDLKISAPRQIFVRGRGVDAELGGDLTIRGNTSNPSVSGAFTLKRGRLEILARRLDFTSGTISFGGGLIPTLNLVATSTAGSTTITVTVAGQANSPTVEFSSSPALPQDEVLAQLIFNRSMSNLSAVQIAQLAAAASQLAGGPSGGLFSSLRSKLGVDDLDISTDAEGRAQVTAGKYLNKRTYLEVTQDPENGGAEATINLDVGRGVKLRGQAGSSGSGAGIFYEREY